MAWAEHEFELDQEVNDSGSTLRNNLRQVEKTTGVTPDKLIGPDPPEVLLYVVDWFIEIHSGRRISSSGLSPLGYDEIYYWQRLTERSLTPLEIRIIKKLDNIFLKVHNGGSRKTRNNS